MSSEALHAPALYGPAEYVSVAATRRITQLLICASLEGCRSTSVITDDEQTDYPQGLPVGLMEQVLRNGVPVADTRCVEHSA
jgi:hypothetical protein